MERQPGETFAFSLSGAGREDSASFHLTVSLYAERKEVWSSTLVDGRIPLDGGQYDSDEWIREVLVAIVEQL